MWTPLLEHPDGEIGQTWITWTNSEDFSACRRLGGLFCMDGEAEVPPHQTCSPGRLAQPQAWPHSWLRWLHPGLGNQQSRPWPGAPPAAGITGSAQPGQRAAGFREGGSFLSADGINMIQHKDVGRALQPGSVPCCHLSRGQTWHLPWGPCRSPRRPGTMPLLSLKHLPASGLPRTAKSCGQGSRNPTK